jgi:putative transposase
MLSLDKFTVFLRAYLILQLSSIIPEEWGHPLLDKFRYLESCMRQEISYVSWMDDISKCRVFYWL